jgi:hypothetical protein
MSSTAINKNGVDCYKIAKYIGIEKENIDNLSNIDNSPSPLFYYTFENPSDNTDIVDESSSATEHGSTGTSTVRSTTAIRGTYSLDIESTDYLTVTHHADLNWDYDDSWTVSVWIKTSTTSYRGIYVKREGSTGYKGPAIFLYNGLIQGYLVSNWAAADSRILKQTTATVNDDNWHNVVVTYDGSGDDAGMLCYIDASLATFVTQGGKTTVGTNSTTNSVNPRVGADTATASMGVGLIDEVAAWNVTLTADQVSILYGAGAPPGISAGL